MRIETVRPHFRERIMCLAPSDTAAYVRLLMDAFPTLRFYERWHNWEIRETQASPPQLRWLDAEGVARVYRAEFQFDPHWAPTWEREDGDRGEWRFTEPGPRPSGVFFVSRLHQEADRFGPPRISESRINIGCIPGNKEQAAIARKMMRLVEKVAVNRYQAVTYPSFERLPHTGKGGVFWIGHDAARWAREAPDRFLTYNGGIGLRPLD